MKDIQKELDKLDSLYNILFWPMMKDITYTTQKEYDSLTKLSKKQLKRFDSEIREFLDSEYALSFQARLVLMDDSPNRVANIYDFLLENHLEMSKILNDQRESFFEALDDSGVPKSILALFEEYEFNEFKVDQGNVIVTMIDNEAFTVRICFENTSLCHDTFPKGLYMRHVYVDRESGKYKMEFLLHDHDYAEEIDVSFICNDITYTVELWDYRRSIISISNYLLDKLWNLSNAISMKKKVLGTSYLNVEEKEILFVAQYLEHSIYSDFIGIQQEITKEKSVNIEAVDDLMRLAQENSCEDIGCILEKLKCSTGQKRYEGLIRKFNKELIKEKNEAFTMTLIKKFENCAMNYPKKFYELLPSSYTKQIKDIIQGIMIDFGYQGQYPLFVKRSSLKGFHIVLQEAMPNFLYNEKDMVSFVECIEIVGSFGIKIDFVCSTVFLKRKEAHRYNTLTVESGFFDDYPKGKRYGKIVEFQTDSSIDSPELMREIKDRLSIFVVIAAKTSMKVKLSKREKEVNSYINPPLWLISSIWILGGFLYGIMMTAGFTVMVFIIGLLFTFTLNGALSLVVDTFFYCLKLSMLAGVAFGFIIWAITLLAGKSGR